MLVVLQNTIGQYACLLKLHYTCIFHPVFLYDSYRCNNSIYFENVKRSLYCTIVILSRDRYSKTETCLSIGGEEEEEEPPKVIVNEIKEEDAFYSKK